MSEITKLYDDINYFLGAPNGLEQQPWENCQLRYGNQLAAISYALGIYPFTKFQELIHFPGRGDQVMYGDGCGVHEQLIKLWNSRVRTPLGILEVGGGRGEVSCATQTLGIATQMIEPSMAVNDLVSKTVDKFKFVCPSIIHNGSLGDCIGRIKMFYDTLIFVESVEHIDEHEFFKAYEAIVSHLHRSNGWMIITNWLWYFPIECIPPYHCFGQDDAVYDKIASFAKRTVYREGSHLVLEF